MTPIRLAVAAVAGLVLAMPPERAHAQSPVDGLGRCLADNTTGKDRKDLARWIFAAMGTHPEIRALSAASPEDLDNVSRSAGALFTRLLADTCAAEAKAAVAAGGAMAIQTGFQVLGQLAMQELMTNPQVTASVGILERYVDKARIDAVLQAR